MNTIMPQSELLKKAVVFIGESKETQPGRKLADIIDEAAMRFNLSPLDSEALIRLFADKGQNAPE